MKTLSKYFVYITVCIFVLLGCENTTNSKPNPKNLDVTAIQVAQKPNKLKYQRNETPDFAGLVVKKVYTDGSSEKTTDFTINAVSTSVLGIVPVTITYEDFTASFNIAVSDQRVETDLPVIYIDTKNSAAITSKEDYVDFAMQIVSDNPDFDVEKTDFEDGIRGRGNNTWDKPKKPYRIKFDKKTSLFGLTEAKSWVLLADYRSPTLLLNAAAFELGQRLDFPFANHFVHVELVLNGRYQGTYILTEQVQVGEGRVDIDEDDGFLVEVDFHYDEEPMFRTSSYNLPVMIKSPEDLTDSSGYDFVKNAMNELTDKIKSSSFPNSGYKDLLDIDSLVDYMLINDILMNIELQVPASVYMYRDAGGKIKFGPLWDYDGGYGYEDNETTFFRDYEGRVPNLPRRNNWGSEQAQAFFNRFFDDPEFVAKYKTRWNTVYSDVSSMTTFFEDQFQKLEKAQALNVQKWYPGTDYQTQNRNLVSWWNNRVKYLNNSINN